MAADGSGNLDDEQCAAAKARGQALAAQSQTQAHGSRAEKVSALAVQAQALGAEAVSRSVTAVQA